MLRLRPSLISVTMAEVKEVELRIRFRNHLNNTMGLDNTSFRQKKASNLLGDQMPVSVSPAPTLQNQESTANACSDKVIAITEPYVAEDGPRAASPRPSDLYATEAASDEEQLPLPSRSRRREARRRIAHETEAHRSDQRPPPSPSRVHWPSTTSSNDPPVERPLSSTRERPTDPHAATANNIARGLLDDDGSGSTDSSQTIGQLVPDLNSMTNDEIPAWGSSPIDLARQLSLDPVALITQIRTPSDDGRQETLSQALSRRREERVDTRLFEPVRHPSAAGNPPPPATPRTPSRFRIYNDSLPASSQPQTPQNLPEARHQSRLHVSWTAPPQGQSSPHPFRTPTTNRVRRGRGRRANASPPGLQTPGFMGLYGGTENTDDSVLFEEASRELESRGIRPTLP